jgi:tetratricopeptide (TPR) repeat protein
MSQQKDAPKDRSRSRPRGQSFAPTPQPGAVDPLTAHLDRGWDLVSRGELAQATLSAQHALELDGKAPEGHTLLGAIRAAEGDTEEAMAHFREAMELDPEYLDPILYAAELSLHPRGEVDECIRLCDEALQLLDTDHREELVDALLLKVDALLMKADEPGARAVLGRLPSGPYAEPVFHLRAGRACYDLGLLSEAEGHLQAVLAADAGVADAYYFMGLIQEQRGDYGGMVRAFRRVRELDLEEPLPPWALSAPAFEAHVGRLVAGLPPRIRSLLGQSPVIAADYPGLELVIEGHDPRSPVLITEGPTLLEEMTESSEPPPDDRLATSTDEEPAASPTEGSLEVSTQSPVKNGHGTNGHNGHGHNGHGHNGWSNGHGRARASGAREGTALAGDMLGGRIDDGTARLGCVFLYRRNLVRSAETVEGFDDEVRHALVHELGHFFGFSDREMEALDLT